jgi:hypothetical protein
MWDPVYSHPEHRFVLRCQLKQKIRETRKEKIDDALLAILRVI